MAPSPSRRTQSEEESALLSSHNHDRESTEIESESDRHPETQGLRPSWQFWRQPSRHVTFAPSDDGEELPAPTTMKRGKKRNWEQVALYAVLILVGVAVGAVFSQGLRRRTVSDGLGDGPMVVPIFQHAPPVRNEITSLPMLMTENSPPVFLGVLLT